MGEYDKYTDDADRSADYDSERNNTEINNESGYRSDFGNSYVSFGQSTSGSGSSSSWTDPDDKKKRKMKGPKRGIIKRAAAIALSAALFGGVAGGVMVGVQYTAQKAGVVAESSSGGTAAIKISDTGSSGSSSNSVGNGAVLGDVSAIVDKVLPSVVSITNTQTYQNYASQYGGYGWPYFFFGGNGYGNGSGESQQQVTGSGSGIIIGQNDDELLMVTNYHVVEDASSLTITFVDDTTAEAALKGTDSDNDLAVVSVKLSDLSEETRNAIKIATMNTSNDCKVGQGVVAIGNALGYGQSITVGYISALNREVKSSDGTSRNLLQTDAAINPGNSGGALINTNGEIIGINSAKYSDTDVEGMGFAIPVSAVSDIINDLMNQKTKVEVAEEQRGYLGITGVTVDSQMSQNLDMPRGVYVYSIPENGAAAGTDLQPKDIITKIDSTKVQSMSDLQDALKYYSKGETVTLTVSRLSGTQYEEIKVELTLGGQVKE